MTEADPASTGAPTSPEPPQQWEAPQVASWALRDIQKTVAANDPGGSRGPS